MRSNPTRIAVLLLVDVNMLQIIIIIIIIIIAAAAASTTTTI
jgi:hypothetical protein